MLEALLLLFFLVVLIIYILKPPKQKKTSKVKQEEDEVEKSVFAPPLQSASEVEAYKALKRHTELKTYMRRHLVYDELEEHETGKYKQADISSAVSETLSYKPKQTKGADLKKAGIEKFETYSEIIKSYPSLKHVPYEKKLQSKEWHEKRLSIIARDNYQCQKCESHETIYVNGGHYWLPKRHYKELMNKSYTSKKTNNGLTPSSKPFYLHVHHEYYIYNELPWEISDDGLITLCNYCHRELHKNNIIPIYVRTDKGLTKMNYTQCYRCDGVGYFPEYKHISGGICFRCSGNRYEELINDEGGLL